MAERRLIGKRATLAGLATLGGAIIGGVACNNTEDGNESPTPTGTVQTLEYFHDPNLLSVDPVGLFAGTEDLISKYFEKRLDFVPIEEIRKQALQLTVEKAEAIFAANQNLPLQFQRVIRKDQEVIEILGRRFDLNNPTDLFIGAALTDYFFQEQFADDLRKEFEFFDYDKQTLDDPGNPVWLRYYLAEIEMGDIPPIARTANLEELAIGLQALQEAGLSIPKKAKIGVFDFFNGDNPYEGVGKDTILLDVWSYPTGEFRVGSSIAEFLIANNPQTLEGYSKVVTEAFNKYRDLITEPRLLSAGDYDYVYGDDAIEFSSFFADYIFDGVGLRKKIAYAKATGHEAEAAILEAKSGYLRQLFGGRGYSVDGKTKEIREYRLGDIIEIEDYEAPRKPVIFLRPEPVAEIDPNWPSVGDRSTIKIIGGPTILLNDRSLEATAMWQVQAGDIVSGRVFVGDTDRLGWISEEWFGEKLQANQ